MDLIAPTYSAASAFHAPRSANGELGINDVSLADLIRTPALAPLLNKLFPGLLETMKTPFAAAYVENVTLLQMIEQAPAYGTGAITQVDAALRALPASERPYYGR